VSWPSPYCVVVDSADSTSPGGLLQIGRQDQSCPVKIVIGVRVGAVRASLTEPEKMQTEKREFSSPKTQVLTKLAVTQNRTRKMKLKIGIRIGAGNFRP
jgi:hypothetical protein